MPEVLSQAQIDALLNGLSASDMEDVSGTSAKKVKEYDFRSPKKFTKEQLRQIESIFENFSRLFSSYLTSVLRVYSQVTVQSIEEQQYHEFNNALPDSVLIGVVDVELDDDDIITENQILIEMSRPISFAVMDRLLGGSGDGVNFDREYTEIEFSLLDNLFRQFVPLLKDAWNSYYEVGVGYGHMETNARLLQTMRPDEIAVIVVSDISIKSLKGTMSICIPAVLLEDLFKKTSLSKSRASRKDSMNDELRKELIMKYLRTTALDVKAVLSESQITLSEVLELQQGDVITLDKIAGTDVSVKVGKDTWFTGKLGLVRNRKAVKINKVNKIVELR